MDAKTKTEHKAGPAPYDPFSPFDILPDFRSQQPTVPEVVNLTSCDMRPKVDATIPPSLTKKKIKTGRINIEELIRMTSEGVPQKEIAAAFSVSEPAVSQAISKLRQSAARPAILDTLTAKEERFVMEIAQGSNQTQAALQAFDCSSLDSAKSIGSRLARDPEISEAITAVMESENMGTRKLVQRLRDHVDSNDPQASLRAVDMGFKIHGSYAPTVAKNLNLNAAICPVDLSRYS